MRNHLFHCFLLVVPSRLKKLVKVSFRPLLANKNLLVDEIFPEVINYLILLIDILNVTLINQSFDFISNYQLVVIFLLFFTVSRWKIEKCFLWNPLVVFDSIILVVHSQKLLIIFAKTLSYF